MSYSKEYQQQIIQLHKDREKHGRRKFHDEEIDFIMNEFNPKSIFDFGCGKGTFLKQMKELYPKIKMIGFDPGIVEYTNVKKVPCELLISCDVLEHVEPDHVDDTLKEIDTLFTKFAFFKIANYEAKAVLPDVRNAHLIQEDENWWKKKVEKNMPKSNIVKCYLHQHRKKRKKDVIVILKK